MFRFVIRKNYVNMLVGLDNKGSLTLDQLAKESGVNYFHMTTVVRQFVNEGIMHRDQEKNIIKISLTDNGKSIASCLRKLMKSIEESVSEEEGGEDKPAGEGKPGEEIKAEESAKGEE